MGLIASSKLDGFEVVAYSTMGGFIGGGDAGRQGGFTIKAPTLMPATQMGYSF